jgi:uncharacterized protein
MKAFVKVALVAGLLAAGLAHADTTPPSDASIHKLMDVMHASALMDGMMGQMKNIMQQSAVQAAGHPLDAKEQQILSDNIGKLAGVMQQQLSWSKLEPAMTDIYRKNFSQKEVNDLLVFYQSPTGQAMIAKMPEVMQESMQIGQAQVRAVLPQIQQISQEMTQQLKDYEASKTSQGGKSS